MSLQFLLDLWIKYLTTSRGHGSLQGWCQEVLILSTGSLWLSRAHQSTHPQGSGRYRLLKQEKWSRPPLTAPFSPPSESLFNKIQATHYSFGARRIRLESQEQGTGSILALFSKHPWGFEGLLLPYFKSKGTSLRTWVWGKISESH